MAPNGRIPWKQIFAYLLDWLLIFAIAAVGGGISFISPYKRTFSLVDLRISYPYRDDVISTSLLVAISLIIPGILIVLIALLFFPIPSSARDFRSLLFWQRKIWEINAGLMGLGLSFAMALLFTQMVKNLFGKPRPDLLARCQPDLANVQRYIVGGAGQDISQRWSMVDVRICTNPDTDMVDEGFRSFFSGHSSSSWSGLLYFSLWLAVKFNITFPFVQQSTLQELTAASKEAEAENEQDSVLPTYNPALQRRKTNLSDHHDLQAYRKSGAAPPVYGVILFFIPLLVAVYIVSTRYQEFKHDGIDLTLGSLVGMLTSYVGYRCYHSTLGRGHAWTWAPRTRENAFFATTSARQRLNVALHRRRAAGDVNGAETNGGVQGKINLVDGEASSPEAQGSHYAQNGGPSNMAHGGGYEAQRPEEAKRV